MGPCSGVHATGRGPCSVGPCSAASAWVLQHGRARAPAKARRLSARWAAAAARDTDRPDGPLSGGRGRLERREIWMDRSTVQRTRSRGQGPGGRWSRQRPRVGGGRDERGGDGHDGAGLVGDGRDDDRDCGHSTRYLPATREAQAQSAEGQGARAKRAAGSVRTHRAGKRGWTRSHLHDSAARSCW